MLPSKYIKRTREVIYAKEEIEMSASYQLIAKLVEVKQKETLLRFFYLPFWKACSATLVLLTGILFLSGAWVFASGLIVFCGFSTYMAHRSHTQLRDVKLQLPKPEMIEISMRSGPPKETVANSQNSSK